MESIEIIRPGMLSTIQDLGRADYQKYGIACGGAMDSFSLRLANILVGNEEGAAAIEATIMGPWLKFKEDIVIAITGANLSPSINESPVHIGKSYKVLSGDILKFGKCQSGCRAYIGVSGGINVPEVLGSRATYMRGSYGGLDGRALKKGDKLEVGAARNHEDVVGRSVAYHALPDIGEIRPVRFIPGPQDDAFTSEAFQTFISKSYVITGQSDRMAYRLEGPKLRHRDSADIISDYITAGSIQVPGNGQPILLMADCQMTGGYTKIGVVIGVDISYLAQRKPSEQIGFRQVSIEEAQELWIKQERMIGRLKINNHF